MRVLIGRIDVMALAAVWVICSAVVLGHGNWLLWGKAFWPLSALILLLLWPQNGLTSLGQTGEVGGDDEDPGQQPSRG